MKNDVLVLIKPDGVYKNLIGNVINKFAHSNLKLRGIKIVPVTKKLAQSHYTELKDKPFFGNIVKYLMGDYHHGSAVIAIVYSGSNAVKKCRIIAGATNPEEADLQSIRGSLGRITTKGLWENVVHVSSDDAQAKREIKLWFNTKELLK